MKQKIVYYCTECGNETPKWAGKCPACGAWNTLDEQLVKPSAKSKVLQTKPISQSVLISDISSAEEIRFKTGMNELNRVLGGGAVRGSIVLVGGSPGVGKSTLLLQLCGNLADSEKILYITGEESPAQLKMRAGRLGIDKGEILVHAGTEISDIFSAISAAKPSVVVVDSIQTTYDSEISATPGSITQVRECAMAIMRLAKEEGFTAFIVGHINKSGNIAGPKVLEHMVDCVLYFEGDQSLGYRILRAAKNRFGSTNEIGVFEMADKGLKEVLNPSEMLLSGRPTDSPGTIVTCIMEGSRPILAEIQALVAKTSFASARRNSNGIDFNRAMLLIAVLEKLVGLKMSERDSYINVVGGLRIDETSADLATLLALVSSYYDKEISSGLAAVGEVGLSGEVRQVAQINQRLAEIARMGFSGCIVPFHSKGEITAPKDLKIIKVKNIKEAIREALTNG